MVGAFVGGMFIGTSFGVCIMALIAMAGRESRREE